MFLDKEVSRGQGVLAYCLWFLAADGRLIRDANFDLHLKRTNRKTYFKFLFDIGEDASLEKTIQYLELRSSAAKEPDSTSTDMPQSWTTLKVRLR